MADYQTTYGLGIKLTGACTSFDNTRDPITFTLNTIDRSSWLNGTDFDGLNNDYTWVADGIDTDDTGNFPGWLHSALGSDNTVYIEGTDAASNVGGATCIITVYDVKAPSVAVVLEGGVSTTDEACRVTSFDVIGATHVIAWLNNATFTETYNAGLALDVVGNPGLVEYTIAQMEGQDLDLSALSDGDIYITFRFKAAPGSNIWIEINKTITLDTVSPVFTLTATGA